MTLRLFDSHPELVVIPGESNFYRVVLDRGPAAILLRGLEALHSSWLSFGFAKFAWPILIAPDRNDMRDRLQFVSRTYKLDDDDFVAAQIEGVLADVDFRSQYWECYLELHRRLTGERTAGKKFYVEKTPAHFRYVPFITAEFGQDARFVHVVRDPRDVISSWLYEEVTDPGARRLQILRISYLWALSCDYARRFRQRLGQRYQLVRYEDLVREPEHVLPRLMAALGLGMDAVTLQPTERAAPVAMNTSYLAEPATCDVSTRQIGRFRQGLSDDERRMIEALVGPQMAACGYAIDDVDQVRNMAIPDEWRGQFRSWIRRRFLRYAQDNAAPLTFVHDGHRESD